MDSGFLLSKNVVENYADPSKVSLPYLVENRPIKISISQKNRIICIIKKKIIFSTYVHVEKIIWLIQQYSKDNILLLKYMVVPEHIILLNAIEAHCNIQPNHKRKILMKFFTFPITPIMLKYSVRNFDLPSLFKEFGKRKIFGGEKTKYKGVFKNMSKSTNKHQSQHLLTLMEANPDIACGFFKGSKEALFKFWRKAETELNSMGPPTKCIAKWKKVWADQKKYVRQKASQNLRDKKCTGGGPSKEQKCSSTEEVIYKLIGMKASVEGVPVRSFGLSSPDIETSVAQLTEFSSAEDSLPGIFEGTGEFIEIEPLNVATNPLLARLKTSNSQKLDEQKDFTKSSFNTLEAELAIQRELLETIKLVAVNQKEQEKTTRKIQISLDDINEENKKHFREMERLKSEEIQEMRRHNEYMEKLRLREVEYKCQKSILQMQMEEY